MDVRLRLHVGLAYGWLLAWSIGSLFAGVEAMALLHAPMLGVGFVATLACGLLHRLVANFRQSPMPSAVWLRIEAAAFLAAALGGVAARYTLLTIEWGHFMWLPLTIFAGLLTFQLRRSGGTVQGMPGDRASGWVLLAVPVYAFLAAGVFLGLGAHPAALHLLFSGVLANIVFVVTHRVIPRTISRPLPQWLHDAQAAAAVVAPLGIAAGILAFPWQWAMMGALAMVTASTLHLVICGWAWATRRNRHPMQPLLTWGALALFVGVGLGFHFLDMPATRVHVPLHAVNNLIGFFGLTILGMGSVMLGVGVQARGDANRITRWLAWAIIPVLAAWEIAAWSDHAGQVWAGRGLAVTVGIHATLGLAVVPRLGGTIKPRWAKKA